jgi:hypothetical protein
MFSVFRKAAPRRAARAFLLACAALWLAGCAALAPQTPEQTVSERCQQRWAAMISGDFKQAWTYTQPGYRAVVKQDDYGKHFGGAGQWEGMRVYSAHCEAERCTVRIILTTKVLVVPFTGQKVTSAVDETWVREDGQWWFYQGL